MAGGTGDGKEVPDEMSIPCLGDIKDHAERVGNASRDQPEQAVPGQVQVKGANDGKNHPSHSQIETKGKFGMTERGNQFGDGSSDGCGPDHTEERPTERALEDQERERGIGTGDQKEDGDVIEDQKHLLGSILSKAVVDHGTEVEEHHGGGKDGDTHHGKGITFLHCRQDKKRCSGHGSDQSDAVADAVGDLFPKRLGSILVCG